MFEKRTPRHFSPPEKVAVLKRHLVEKVPVSDLCYELDIYPNQFYCWLKDFFENGHLAYESDRKSKCVENAKDQKIEQLEAKVTRKNEVLAELMEHTCRRKRTVIDRLLRFSNPQRPLPFAGR